MAFPPISILGEKHSKIRKRAAKHFAGLAALSTHSAGRRLPYTPCLLMKPVLRLRLHATQSQSCFPAASNALALPGGNGIFTATPTERITHYTLQAKSCAKGQAPLETPDNKTGGMLPSLGAYRRLLSAAPFTVCFRPL